MLSSLLSLRRSRYRSRLLGRTSCSCVRKLLEESAIIVYLTQAKRVGCIDDSLCVRVCVQLRNQERGELLVSLCHQPAANRLTVVVLKARNLPKMDVTGLAGTHTLCDYELWKYGRLKEKRSAAP